LIFIFLIDLELWRKTILYGMMIKNDAMTYKATRVEL